MPEVRRVLLALTASQVSYTGIWVPGLVVKLSADTYIHLRVPGVQTRSHSRLQVSVTVLSGGQHVMDQVAEGLPATWER